MLVTHGNAPFVLDGSRVMILNHSQATVDYSSCVIVGRSSDYILRNRDDVLNVFIYAPQEDEIAAVMKEKGIKNMRKAKEEWESVDKAQHARHEYITGKKRGDRHTRDMLINSSILGWDETADMIIDMIDRKFEQDDAKQLKKEA